MGIPVEAATAVVVMLMTGGVMLIIDAGRQSSCRWCEHCRRKADDERTARALRRHRAYHQFTDRAPSACDDPDCPGRR